MLPRYLSSVHPSVTSQYCTKTAKRRIMQTTPYDRSATLVYWCQRSWQNSDGVIPNGAPNEGGVSQNWRLSTNISLHLNNNLSYHRGIVRRSILVSSCYVSRGMAVRKVSEVIQGHWHWCHSIGHIPFPISLPLQLPLSCTANEMLSLTSQNLKSSRDSEYIPLKKVKFSHTRYRALGP